MANQAGQGAGSHAMSLDGDGDYVDLSSHASGFPTGGATRSVAAWFNPSSGVKGVFAYGNSGPGRRFAVRAGLAQASISAGSHLWGATGLSLAAGWHHVAVTFPSGETTSDKFKVYVDGVLQTSSTLNGSPRAVNTGASVAYIGRNSDGSDEFKGLIDDVRLYNVELTAEQVLHLYQNPAGDSGGGGGAPPTFDDGASKTLTIAENHADGAAVGAVPASDANDDTLTYSLTGADAATFTIDAQGAIAVAAGVILDRETKASYTLTVQVTDGKDASGANEQSPTVDATIAVTIMVTDVAEPPGKPDPPAVAAASATSITVNWTAPENTGPDIDDYDVQYRRTGDTQWSDHTHDGTGTSATITGLVTGASYQARVRAGNDEEKGEWSEAGEGSTGPAPLTLSGPLTEDRLDGAVVTATLNYHTLEAAITADQVMLIGLSGLTIDSLVRTSDNQLTLTLGFDGSDMTADAELTVTVAAETIVGSTDPLTATLTVLEGDFYQVSSPDGSLTATVRSSGAGLSYRVIRNGDELIAFSPLSIRSGVRHAVTSTATTSHDSTWTPTWGQFGSIRDLHNRLTLTVQVGDAQFELSFKVYDDGLGFRFAAEEQAALVGSTTVFDVLYNLYGEYMARFPRGEHSPEGPFRLDSESIRSNPPTPIVIDAGAKGWLALLESDLFSTETFPSMLFEKAAGEPTLRAAIQSAALPPGDFRTPWRVVLVGDAPGDLLESTVAVNLAAPLALDDASWVKPGKALFNWRTLGYRANRGFVYGVNTRTLRRLIDFVAEQGLEYVQVDDEWFKRIEYPDIVRQAPNFDIEEVIAHANAKGVRIVIYVDREPAEFITRTSDEQLYRIFADLGASAIKYGFRRNNAPFTRAALQSAAEKQMLMNFHDNPTPLTGARRTMPNAITRQTGWGQQDGRRAFAPEDFLEMAMINALLGPFDQINGIYDINEMPDRTKGADNPINTTVASENARVLVTFTGMAMLPDVPEEYRKKIDMFEFLRELPMTWDETRVLHSQMPTPGQGDGHITTARRSGAEWFVCSVSGENPRTLAIPMDFLDTTLTYDVTYYEDDHDGDTPTHYIDNRETYQVRFGSVASTDTVNAVMVAGGGHCMWIRPQGPPVVEGAVVDGDELVITFSEPLAAATLPASAFTVKRTPFGGSAQTVALDGAPAIHPHNDKRLILALAAAVASTDAVTVGYQKPSTGTGNQLADDHGHEVETFSGQVVTNNSPAPPTFDGGASKTLTIAENHADGAAVGAVPASDSNNDALTYSLAGTDAGTFTIGAQGAIAVVSGTILDHEAKASYALTARVTDGKNAAGDRERPPLIDATIAVTIMVTDVAEPPGKPVAPTVSTASATSITVSWAEPSNTGPPIDDYDIQYRRAGDTQWSDHGHDGTGTSATITGLVTGASYQARVRAGNDEGEGEWSAEGSGHTGPAGVQSAATNAEGDAVFISFSKDLGSPGPLAAYSVTVDGGEQVPAGVTASGDSLALVLGTAIEAGQIVTVSYAKPGSGAKLLDADGLEVDSFSNQMVSNWVPSAPTVIRAALIGKSLAIRFHEPLDASSVPTGSAFSVKLDGAGVALVSASPITVSASTLTLTLAAVPTAGAVTVSYARALADNRLRDGNGNEAADFSDLIVLRPAQVQSAATNAEGDAVFISFSKDLGSPGPLAAYSVTVDGGEQVPAGVTASGDSLALVLGTAIEAGQTVTVGYAKPDSGIRLVDADSLEVDSFSGQAVSVAVPKPPDPIAHWPLDGNADDAIGSADGTLQSDASFVANQAGQGVGSHALTLDGNRDYVNVSHRVRRYPTGTSARTVSAWFNSHPSGAAKPIFAYGGVGPGRRFEFAANRSEVSVAVNQHFWGAYFEERPPGWNHVVVTLPANANSDEFDIYWNGALLVPSTLNGSPRPVNTRPLAGFIGRGTEGDYFTGLIDDVRLYDYELSDGQVRYLYENPNPVATTATLALDRSSVAENAGPTAVTVTATLGGVNNFSEDKAIVVSVGRKGDGAVLGTDFAQVVDVEVTIAARQSSGSASFTLEPIDDSLDESDEMLTVYGTLTGLVIADAGLTINDDDAATAAVSVGDPSAAATEGDSPTATVDLAFPVSLSAASGRAVTVTYTLGGTATAGSDYEDPDPKSITIPAGEGTGSIVIKVKGDVVDEQSETIEVTLAGATNAVLSSTPGALTGTGTINDDDSAELSIGSASAAEGNKVAFTITLDPVSDRPVTVEWVTAADPDGDNPAGAGDYTAVSPAQTVTFAAGDASKAVEVQTTEDALDEENGTFLVKLSAPTNATLDASAASATGTINDDDAATAAVSVGDPSAAATEGDSPTATVDLAFPVSLSAASGRAVTVTYTLGGTATAGSDYEDPDPKSITIPAGEGTGSIVIKVKGDVVDEQSETIEVTLAGATNAVLSSTPGALTGTGTINDDDADPTVTPPIEDESGVTEEPGTTSVRVTATLESESFTPANDPGSARNVADLEVELPSGQIALAPLLSFFRDTGGLKRWGHPASAVLEIESGTLTQFFEHGAIDFHDVGDGYLIERRLVWDYIGGGLGGSIDQGVEPGTVNPHPGLVLGPWGHRVSNQAIDGQFVGFLDFFIANGGVSSFGYPKTDARVDRDQEGTLRAPGTRVGVVRQYFQAAVFEFDPNDPDDPVKLLPLGAIVGTTRSGTGPE